MRALIFACAVALTLVAAPSQAQIPLASVKVVGSNPAVLNYPTTASLDSFGVARGQMTIHTTGTETWPAVAIEPGGEPAQSGTLWVFLRIGDQWYATGAERLRPLIRTA